MYGDGLSERSARYSDERRGAERHRHALRQHDLHDVAGGDVLARAGDRALKFFRAELALRRRRWPCAVASGISTGWPQHAPQRLQALQRVAIGVGLRRIGVDDEGDLALKIVDDGQLLGRAAAGCRGWPPALARRRRRRRGEPLLDVAHRVVGEIAGQAAAESRQPGDRRGAVALQKRRDEVERVAPVALGDDAAVADFDVVAAARRCAPSPADR